MPQASEVPYSMTAAAPAVPASRLREPIAGCGLRIRDTRKCVSPARSRPITASSAESGRPRTLPAAAKPTSTTTTHGRCPAGSSCRATNKEGLARRVSGKRPLLERLVEETPPPFAPDSMSDHRSARRSPTRSLTQRSPPRRGPCGEGHILPVVWSSDGPHPPEDDPVAGDVADSVDSLSPKGIGRPVIDCGGEAQPCNRASVPAEAVHTPRSRLLIASNPATLAEGSHRSVAEGRSGSGTSSRAEVR
jgi:hypothetical protein